MLVLPFPSRAHLRDDVISYLLRGTQSTPVFVTRNEPGTAQAQAQVLLVTGRPSLLRGLT
jgi:hypothetical protein